MVAALVILGIVGYAGVYSGVSELNGPHPISWWDALKGPTIAVPAGPSNAPPGRRRAPARGPASRRVRPVLPHGVTR